MPNHVTTVIEIDDLGGEDLSVVHAAMLNTDGHVDFDVILPSPKCLAEFKPNAGVVARAKMALGLLQEPSKDPFELADFTANMAFNSAVRNMITPLDSEHIQTVARAILNYEECGQVYWYDWNIKHWGTKWNAYRQPDGGYGAEDVRFSLETAWSHPEKVIKSLSARLPSVRFTIKYADEETGCNCGWYEIQGGKRTAETIAPRYNDQTLEQRRSFTKFAFELRNPNSDPVKYGYDENWDYREEIEA